MQRPVHLSLEQIEILLGDGRVQKYRANMSSEIMDIVCFALKMGVTHVFVDYFRP